ALLPLAAPGALLAGIPALSLSFLAPLAGLPAPVGPLSWQAAPLLPVTIVAAIEGADALLRWAKTRQWERPAVRGTALVVLAATLAAGYSESPLTAGTAVQPPAAASLAGAAPEPAAAAHTVQRQRSGAGSADRQRRSLDDGSSG
ncbi:MAG: hypothetical protein NTZ05_23405, partial [Chloroflexi bacterium]|nr:hypothetical protein [Chloroflexota bacterium]